MKLLLLTIFLISCGKAPFFSSLENTSDDKKVLPFTAQDIFTFNSNLNFGMKWNQKPTVSEKSSFTIKFWDKENGHFLGPYSKPENPLCVFIWMIMPDGSEHGSSPVLVTENNESYFVDDLYFIMPGSWKLYIRTVESINQCNHSKFDPFIEEYIFDFKVK